MGLGEIRLGEMGLGEMGQNRWSNGVAGCEAWCVWSTFYTALLTSSRIKCM